jgi:cysteine desulfurase / selenocysteine lyase
MIYLDNAATSWPKPPEVLQAMNDAIAQSGGNPGRSGHRLSIQAARLVYDCRENLAAFFHLADPLRVIFTPNATYAINLVLKGWLRPGDQVVATSMEHNAVLRPLRYLESRGVRVKIVECSATGSLDSGALEQAMGPATRLVVCLHASNVSGTLLPVEQITTIAHRQGARVLVDAAQTAGLLPLDMDHSGFDFLAFSGHKDLLGPAGTGGLLIHPDVAAAALEPLVQGGTGSRSESELQPEDLPDKYEAGTLNFPGLAGLLAGLNWLRQIGPENARAHSIKLKTILVEGLSVIPGVRIYGPLDPALTTGLVSFTIQGRVVSDIGFRLDEDYGILSRVGLHCAPSAHRTLGSWPEGTIRLSPGLFTTLEDIQQTLSAIQEVARS